MFSRRGSSATFQLQAKSFPRDAKIKMARAIHSFTSLSPWGCRDKSSGEGDVQSQWSPMKHYFPCGCTSLKIGGNSTPLDPPWRWGKASRAKDVKLELLGRQPQHLNSLHLYFRIFFLVCCCVFSYFLVCLVAWVFFIFKCVVVVI